MSESGARFFRPLRGSFQVAPGKEGTHPELRVSRAGILQRVTETGVAPGPIPDGIRS